MSNEVYEQIKQLIRSFNAYQLTDKHREGLVSAIELYQAAYNRDISDSSPRKGAEVAVTAAMVNAAWNEAKTRRMTGLPNDFRAVLEAALASAPAPASGRVDAVLNLYREAVRIDVKMEGPQFMGANSSALKRAWEADRASLSPAATPVSEAGGDETTKIALGHFKTTTERAQRITELERHLQWALDNLHMIGDQSDEAEQARAALAKPASPPAGVDLVREALEAYHDAYSDRRFAPEGSHEAYDAAARLEDAHNLASRALSQSTSAGKADGP